MKISKSVELGYHFQSTFNFIRFRLQIARQTVSERSNSITFTFQIHFGTCFCCFQLLPDFVATLIEQHKQNKEYTMEIQIAEQPYSSMQSLLEDD